MQVFTIDPQNRITRPDTQSAAEPPGETAFRSEQELSELARPWPLARLVEIWNQLPGQTAVRRFTDRPTAVRRIWRALQTEAATTAPRAPAVASTLRSSGHKARRAGKACTAPQTKTARILALLRQPQGVTLAALMRATDWQAHSVRGFLSGHVGKKLKLKVKSFARDGERVYALQP